MNSIHITRKRNENNSKHEKEEILFYSGEGKENMDGNGSNGSGNPSTSQQQRQQQQPASKQATNPNQPNRAARGPSIHHPVVVSHTARRQTLRPNNIRALYTTKPCRDREWGKTIGSQHIVALDGCSV